VRGKRNDPHHVRYVSEKLASVKNEDAEKVAEATVKNTERLFGIR
jgi:Tat protein secretion system quality control protein TatD with DNase activity